MSSFWKRPLFDLGISCLNRLANRGFPAEVSVFLFPVRSSPQAGQRSEPTLPRSSCKLMISVFIGLGILAIVLPVSGLLWFWFVRSQD